MPGLASSLLSQGQTYSPIVKLKVPGVFFLGHTEVKVRAFILVDFPSPASPLKRPIQTRVCFYDQPFHQATMQRFGLHIDDSVSICGIKDEVGHFTASSRSFSESFCDPSISITNFQSQGWTRIMTKQPLPARLVRVDHDKKLGFSFFVKEVSNTSQARAFLEKFLSSVEGGSGAARQYPDNFKNYSSFLPASFWRAIEEPSEVLPSSSAPMPACNDDNDFKEECICCMSAPASYGYKHGDTYAPTSQFDPV